MFDIKKARKITFCSIFLSGIIFTSPSFATCYSVMKVSGQGKLLMDVNKRMKAYGRKNSGGKQITLKCSNGSKATIIKLGRNFYSVSGGIWSNIDNAARSNCGC